MVTQVWKEMPDSESTKTEFSGGIRSGGSEYWKNSDGNLHRLDGPASQWKGGVSRGGGEGWFVEGVPHRIGGPASVWGGGIENGGSEWWFRKGELHREDGPAASLKGGHTSKLGSEEYWLYGVEFSSKQDFEDALAHLRRTAKPETNTAS